uniref:Ig-like domain-containing protein n=1 Tax=Cyprinus carpio TaxID=7962 RepID=A0A8C1WDJ7_CYPCA
MRKESTCLWLVRRNLEQDLLYQVCRHSNCFFKSTYFFATTIWDSCHMSCCDVLFFISPLGGAINRPLHDVTVAESQTAELECEVANPTTEGKWLKDGHPVDFSDNIVSENNGAVRRLVIVITRPQDVGEYTYQVANSKTSGNLKVEDVFQYSLIFFFLAIKIVKKPRDVKSLLGATASFELSLSHDDIPVQWMLNNQELAPSSNIKILSERKAHKLIIQSVEGHMAGEYIAVVGHLQCSAHLQVECKVTKPLKNIEVPETHVATFECEVSHFNVPSIWLKNGVEIEMNEKFGIVVQGKLHQLKVMNASQEDASEYTFVCGNDKVSGNLIVKHIKVTEKKKAIFECELSEPNVPVMWMKDGQELEMSERYIFTFNGDAYFTTKLQDYTAVEKDEVTFDCELSRDVPVKWFKNEIEIKASKMVTIKVEGKRRILNLKKVENKDKGLYVCDCGTDKTSANLNIEGWCKTHINTLQLQSFPIWRSGLPGSKC